MLGKYPAKDAWGRPRTAFAVCCGGAFDVPGSGHGLVYLTDEEYDRQMSSPDSLWKCPFCRYEAQWDDDNYEQMTEESA